MQLITLTQCKRSLSPLPACQNWPDSLPGLSLHGLILTGSQQKSFLNCEMEARSRELENFLLQSFPQLGLSTLAHWSTDPEFSSLVDLSSFLPAYGLRPTPETLESLSRMKQAPYSFQQWVNERKLSFKEFAITKLATDQANELTKLFEMIPKLELSRQLGAKALELGCELIAMGKTLPQEAITSADWMRALEELRYPRATKSDQSASEKLKSIKLPTQFQAQWVRRGDMSGAEIRFFVSSDYDFSKKIDRLQKLRENFAKDLFKDSYE